MSAVRDQTMSIALHIVAGVFALTAVVFLIIYLYVRDFGYLLMTLLCGVSSALSFWFSSWWPLLPGGILAAMFLVLGSGAWKWKR
jgi:hypothetical protein